MGWLPPQVDALLYLFMGLVEYVPDLCAAPDPGYPEFEAADLLDFDLLKTKVLQWIKATLWRENCQCKTGPGG